MATLSSLLVHDEVVSVSVIEDALQRQVLEGGDIDTALLELGALPENVLNAYRAASYGLKAATRDQVMEASAEHLQLVPPELAKRHRVVPIGREGSKVLLGVAEPPEKVARDELRKLLGHEIELRVAVEARIEAGLAVHYGLDIPGRMRRLAEQLRTRDAGTLPAIRVGSVEPTRRSELTDDILKAFDSEPPPHRPVVEERPSLAGPRPAVSVAPMVRLGAPVRAAAKPVQRPSVEAPPPPGVTSAPEPDAPRPRTSSAPPTSRGFAVLPASEPPAEPASRRSRSAPTAPAFSLPPETLAAAQASARAPATRIETRAAPRRPAGAGPSAGVRRAAALPLGPLSADVARERIEAAADRDEVIEVFFAFARQYFESTALFALRDEQALGLEARGLAGAIDIAGVAVPVAKGSALEEAERSRLPRVIDLSRHDEDQALVDALGRRAAQPSALVPVLIRQRAVFALYGDRAGAFFNVEDVADLVELLPAVSRAFERIIRTRKVFAREVRSQPRPELAAPQATPSMGPPLGTWGGGVVLTSESTLPEEPAVPASVFEAPEVHPSSAAVPVEPEAPAAAVAVAELPPSKVPLEPVVRGDRGPAWPPRPDTRPLTESPARAAERLDRVSSPFVRAAPARLPPERALAPLGLSRDAPPPPRFATGLSTPPVDMERNPTVKLPRASAPPAEPVEPTRRSGKPLSNKPPPGTGTYSAEPPPPETLRPARVPAEAKGARRKTDRPHRRSDDALARPDAAQGRRSRPPHAPARAIAEDSRPTTKMPAVDAEQVVRDLVAERDDPRDTVRQRPAPVRRRPDEIGSYSVQGGRSEIVSVLPPPAEVSEPRPAADDASDAKLARVDATAARTDTKAARPDAPAAATPFDATAPKSIIVELDAEVEALVADLMRCGPDDEAPVLARIARIGEPALPVLAERFPGPLWFDRRQAYQRLPRGRDVSAIARAFAAFGERADRYLITLLESPSPEIRFYATLLAVDSLRPALLSALADRLFDGDAKIRLLVLDALGAYQHLPGFDVVLDGLRVRARDPRASLQSRMTAIDALAQLRDVDSVELLIELTIHPDRQLSVPAHRALVAITAQDFGNAERKWRSWLKRSGDQYRAEWLIDGLMHSDEKVRVIAGRELQELSQVYFGYVASSAKRERERAQRRYQDWWRNEGLPALQAEPDEQD